MLVEGDHKLLTHYWYIQNHTYSYSLVQISVHSRHEEFQFYRIWSLVAYVGFLMVLAVVKLRWVGAFISTIQFTKF